MSQQDMIRQGEIQKRKQEQLLAVTSAKAALRALVNDATYSISKPVSEINTALLSAHLTQLIEKQEEEHRLNEEIKELSY
jgi:hypothetical protein